MVVLSSLPARNVYPPDPRRAVPFRSPKSYNSFPFQPLTNSFPQRRQPISFSHNSLHTLLPLTDSFFRRRFLPSSQPRPTERLTSLTPITCSLLALFLRPLSFLFSSLQLFSQNTRVGYPASSSAASAMRIFAAALSPRFSLCSLCRRLPRLSRGGKSNLASGLDPGSVPFAGAA